MKKMDDEYTRILQLDNLKELFECEKGYVDQEDCSWYHSNWMLLRYLGVVSNPFWHENFYHNVINKYTNNQTKVLVLGTADFSMPYLCQLEGIDDITICDICKTPLNICKCTAAYHGFSWKTEQKNIFDGINGKYDVVINDAFITRFEYEKKKTVLNHIWDTLKDDGIYITTMRHDWNGGEALAPSISEKYDFVQKVIHRAEEKSIDITKARNAAEQYIDKMKSYPVKNSQMISDFISGKFFVEFFEEDSVEGECVETQYYRIVLRKCHEKYSN